MCLEDCGLGPGPRGSSCSERKDSTEHSTEEEGEGSTAASAPRT